MISISKPLIKDSRVRACCYFKEAGCCVAQKGTNPQVGTVTALINGYNVILQ